jgi:hypothetical protein
MENGSHTIQIGLAAHLKMKVANIVEFINFNLLNGTVVNVPLLSKEEKAVWDFIKANGRERSETAAHVLVTFCTLDNENFYFDNLLAANRFVTLYARTNHIKLNEDFMEFIITQGDSLNCRKN